MAKQTYSKEERKAQFLATGLDLARKIGVTKVSAAAVAAKHKVTAPLVFHIFGSREKLQAAIKREAKKRNVNVLEPKSATSTPKRKRTVAEVKAIKDKAAGKRPAVVKKAAASKPKAPAKKPADAPAKKKPNPAAKFPTLRTPASTGDAPVVNQEPKASL